MLERNRVVPLRELTHHPRNSRTHPRQQIELLKSLLLEYGWTRPLGVADGILHWGHGVHTAALELAEAGKCPAQWHDANLAPVVDVSYLTEDQRRALIIADNKSAEMSVWDKDMLAMELGDLKESGFDLSLAGYGDAELDALLNGWEPDMDKIDAVPPGDAPLLGTVKVKAPQEIVGAIEEAIKELITQRGWTEVEVSV